MTDERYGDEPYSMENLPPGHLRATLETLAVEIALEAGRLVRDERPRDLGVADTKTSDTDVVTVMDRAAEQLIRERLHETRPQDGILGEEGGGGQPGTSGVTWVVDPIDGTVNYLYELPVYAVSVAAVVGDATVPGRWRPVAGAVVSPVVGEVYRAQLGGGAYLEAGGRTTRLASSAAYELGKALVGTGFGYAPQRRAWQGEVLRQVLPAVRDIRRIGSAALDLCCVAAGRMDAYWERGLNPWDLAAGWLVCTEAGVVLGGPRPGDDPQTQLTWASAPGVAEAFAALLSSAVAAAGVEESDG